MAKKEEKNLFEDCSFICGDSLTVLKSLSAHSVDLVLSSPPYMNLRKKYWKDLDEFLNYFLKCTFQIKRILKEEGSLWLNFGNYYQSGSLVLLGETVVSTIVSRQHWILVNDVIWRKNSSLPISSSKRLTNTYEHIFHLVKNKNYYVNQEAFRTYKRKETSSSTLSGVTGSNYLRRIKDSPYLSEVQKEQALLTTKQLLKEVKEGSLLDFRLLLKGDNSIINGPNSGRAKEIDEKGFAVLRYLDYGRLGDVWDISVNQEGLHDSAFPEELCVYPIIATCPKGGLVVDPFCGSGTTNIVANKNGRRSLGIDLEQRNIELCLKRAK